MAQLGGLWRFGVATWALGSAALAGAGADTEDRSGAKVLRDIKVIKRMAYG